MSEEKSCQYPPNVHPVLIPKGHRVAILFEQGGGIIREVHLSEESVHQTKEDMASIERENAALKSELAKARETIAKFNSIQEIAEVGATIFTLQSECDRLDSENKVLREAIRQHSRQRCGLEEDLILVLREWPIRAGGEKR